MDIHASEITIVATGGPVSHRASTSAVLAAAALLAAALLAFILFKRREKTHPR